MDKNRRTELETAAQEVVGGKSSKDCTIDEVIQVSRRAGGLSRRPGETPKEHLDRINRFRRGW